MKRTRKVITRLLQQYTYEPRPRTGDPFKTLIGTILSQNTNSKNRNTAYDRLESHVGVTPEKLASVDVGIIRDAIRPAGMYNQRSIRIKDASTYVLYEYDGDLKTIVKLPYLAARDKLMAIPGVGWKTADVVLLFEANKTVIPIDTHIFRVTKRLELVPSNAPYETVRNTLEADTPEGMHENVHVLLIRFGREVCKAHRPRCGTCFLNDLCTYLSMQE